MTSLDRDDPTQWTATGGGGTVAAAHRLAAEAGIELLRAGGNAADAAIAVSLSLGVCEPAGSGLGGMAHALTFWEGTARTLEGPCRCPASATEEALAAAPSRYRGYRAVAVPGAPKVLHHLATRHARLSPDAWVAPAVRQAREGVVVGATLQELLVRYSEALTEGSVGALLSPTLVEGDVLRQPRLANTLEHLARVGFEDFYRGDIASEIARAMHAHDGFVTAEDLANMPAAKARAPLSTRFAGDDVFTLGPPGGGYALLELCNLVEALGGVGELDLGTSRGVVTAAKLIQRSRQDRRKWARRMAAEELAEGAAILTSTHAEEAVAAMGIGETSHFCVVDADGNAVSMTQSIERSFGAAEWIPDLGFLFNGFMRAFKVGWPSHPHAVAPGVAARSNAAPTITVADGQVKSLVGATGSERAVAAIFLTLLRLARGESPFDAAWGPRLHATPEGKVLLEVGRHASDVPSALERASFQLEDVGPYAFKMGGLQLITRVAAGLTAVADPRRDGGAFAIA